MPNFKVALQNGEEFDFEVLDGKDGLPGAKGEKGDTGPKGDTGENGKNGKDGKDGKDGTNGRDGLDGRDGTDGKDGKDGVDGKDAKFSLPEIKKIAKELSKDSNLAWQTVPHLNSIVAGENITIDNSDPLNPIVSSLGSISPQEMTFEYVSKNLSSYPYTLSYSLDILQSISYNVNGQTITKTLNRTGDKITSIVLSGDVPSGITATTKSLAYTGDVLTAITYS